VGISLIKWKISSPLTIPFNGISCHGLINLS
jgi:hypothetical protein